MNSLIKKHSKVIAVLIGIAFILPLFYANTRGIELTKTESEIAANEEARAAQRSGFLLSTTVGQDFINEMKSKGYTEDEITAVKMLVERIIFQLDEITRAKDLSVTPTVGETRKNDEEDMQPYIKLLESINIKKAIYLALSLKKEFGSTEKAVDEYLCALQLDLDLEEYLVNRDAYLKKKSEKSSTAKKVLTIFLIEEAMLKSLERDNEKNRDFGYQEPQETGAKTQKRTNEIVPAVPAPDIQEIKPANPRDEIAQELNILNPNSNW